MKTTYLLIPLLVIFASACQKNTDLASEASLPSQINLRVENNTLAFSNTASYEAFLNMPAAQRRQQLDRTSGYSNMSKMAAGRELQTGPGGGSGCSVPADLIDFVALL